MKDPGNEVGMTGVGMITIQCKTTPALESFPEVLRFPQPEDLKNLFLMIQLEIY